MASDRTSSIYLRFAICSLAITAITAASFAFLALRVISAAQERATAHTSAAAVAGPLQALFGTVAPAEPAPPVLLSQADSLTRQLLSETIRGVRVWDAGGSSQYTAGVTPSGSRPPSGASLSWRRIIDPDGQSLFVTYVPFDGYIIEIDQSPAELDSSIASAQRSLLILVALFAISAYGVLQIALRFGVRNYAEGHRQLLHMYNSGDRIRSSLDLHEVVTHLSRDVTSLARATHGVVALFDEATSELTLRATYDEATGAVTHHQRAVDDWFMRRCAATNTTITSVEPASTYRQFFRDDVPVDHRVHLLCVPVSLRDHVAGVVLTLRPADGKRPAFTATETAHVEELAGQAVTAVEQAQLFAKVRAHANEIELSYDATLKALMAALDAKDEVTEGHCERVAKLTIQLAKHMGIAEPQLIDIERGALLHDVGKIGVPDAVLKKPAALNEGEWEAMRKHPLLASLMVSKIGFLEGAMPILLYHHERYDGEGYPFGLTSSKIPLEARIFSIIDAYDAMTSDRPYRDAMDHAAAIDEIASNSGGQFDPDVVAAFVELMSSRPELQHVSAPRHGDDREIDEDLPAPPAEAA